MPESEVYRRAASAVILRPSESPGAQKGSFQILLLHKPRKRDAWQLPQGGIEAGETALQAALRELQEEASVTDCDVLGVSEHVYQYDFPDSYRRFRPDNVKGQRIEYVFALAPAHAAVRVDRKEIDAYLWVEESQLGRHIKRAPYLALIRQLCAEAIALAEQKMR